MLRERARIGHSASVSEPDLESYGTAWYPTSALRLSLYTAYPITIYCKVYIKHIICLCKPEYPLCIQITALIRLR